MNGGITSSNVLKTVALKQTNKVYLSIYGIYIASFQGNYTESLPARGENKSFKELVKRAGQITWKRAGM